MNEEEKRQYMETAAYKLLNWMSIEDSRTLTGIERIMSQGIAQDYDAKIAQGWPDTMDSLVSF